MILGNDFDYIPDIEPESEDVLDSFIAHNNWRSEVKRTSSGSKEHSVSGKHVCSMVDAIVNGNFIDRRNPLIIEVDTVLKLYLLGKQSDIEIDISSLPERISPYFPV